MTLDELRKEAEKFYEWPSDTKDHVTLTSSLIFAQLMIQRTQKALERPAPCLNFCEATAFKIEIRKLKSAIRETIEDNLHLADGENCTLIKLKRAIGYT